MTGNQGQEPMGSPTPRPRRREHLMPTRHKLNPNWTRRGDNTKYRGKK